MGDHVGGGFRAAGQAAAPEGPHLHHGRASHTERRTGIDQSLARPHSEGGEGPAFLNVFAPCPRGWRHAYNKTVEMAKSAVDTTFWPLFEVDHGEWKLTKKVRDRAPIEEFLKPQGRFKHLFKPENAALLEEIQADVDAYYKYVERRCDTG